MNPPKKTRKRKRETNPRIDGDISCANVVTYKTITETKQDGTTVERRVMVSMDLPSKGSTSVELSEETFVNNYEPENMSPPPVRLNRYRVGV